MWSKVLISLTLWMTLSFPTLIRPRAIPVGAEVPPVVFRFKGAEVNRWFSSEKIPEDVLARMRGKSLPERAPSDTTAPKVNVDELRYLRILYCSYDGRTKVGELVCNQAVSSDLLEIFKELYKQKYPIASVRLVDDFDADDEKSMAADNTSSFNFRTVDGKQTLSRHARGMAVDINPLYNPCVKGQKVQPATGKPYVDRTADFPHKITAEDLCCRLFKQHGWRWGGDWRTMKDYQHFDKK